MNDETEKIPPFVQDYLDKMEYEGYADFVKLSRDFHKEREEYPGKHATQSAYLNDFNRTTGQNKKLDYDEGLKAIDTRFKQRAYSVAKQHGYKGPDPNQPSDKEFTKQGEKFMGMIDRARQRQQEQTKQPEQKQKVTSGKETESIDKLKEQQSYHQHQPKVEFGTIGQQQPSGIDQQRSAFLSQIKKTREQQTQGPDKQLEI